MNPVIFSKCERLLYKPPFWSIGVQQTESTQFTFADYTKSITLNFDLNYLKTNLISDLPAGIVTIPENGFYQIQVEFPFNILFDSSYERNELVKYQINILKNGTKIANNHGETVWIWSATETWEQLNTSISCSQLVRLNQNDQLSVEILFTCDIEDEAIPAIKISWGTNLSNPDIMMNHFSGYLVSK